MKKKYLYIFLMILLMAFLWAAAWVFTKVAVKEIDPFFFTFLRFVFAAFFIIPFVIKKLPKKNWWKLFLLSLFAMWNVVLYAVGIKYTTVLSWSIIYLLSPILVLLLSILIFKNKTKKLNILWIFLWFMGAAIIVLLPVIYGWDYSIWWMLGNMLILWAMLSFTIYTMWSKSIQKTFDVETITAWFLFVTLIATWVISLIKWDLFVDQVSNLSNIAWLSIAIVGVLGTWLQYLLQQLVIKKNTSLDWSLFLYVQPAAVVVLAVPILWEKVTYLFVIGAVLALIWVRLSSRK
jgi:drug/metabolite transporter (DMT)-like permease